MTRKQSKAAVTEFKEVLASDRDFLRPLVEEIVQQVLEAEMEEAVGAQKGERTATRLGYRSGYYPRTLVTRVGKLELRMSMSLVFDGGVGRIFDGPPLGWIALLGSVPLVTL